MCVAQGFREEADSLLALSRSRSLCLSMRAARLCERELVTGGSPRRWRLYLCACVRVPPTSFTLMWCYSNFFLLFLLPSTSSFSCSSSLLWDSYRHLVSSRRRLWGIIIEWGCVLFLIIGLWWVAFIAHHLGLSYWFCGTLGCCESSTFSHWINRMSANEILNY